MKEEQQEEKNRGGRPKLSQGKRKSAKIVIHLTEAQKAKLEKCRSMTRFKSLSPFILEIVRFALFSREGIGSRVNLINLTADERRALQGIGNNLNQMTRLLHSGRKIDKKVLEQVAETKALLQKLNTRIARASKQQEARDDT